MRAGDLSFPVICISKLFHVVLICIYKLFHMNRCRQMSNKICGSWMTTPSLIEYYNSNSFTACLNEWKLDSSNPASTSYSLTHVVLEILTTMGMRLETLCHYDFCFVTYCSWNTHNGRPLRCIWKHYVTVTHGKSNLLHLLFANKTKQTLRPMTTKFNAKILLLHLKDVQWRFE